MKEPHCRTSFAIGHSGIDWSLYHAAKPEMSEVLGALKKLPAGTNYTVDLFALKIGYIQDGSHRQVFDLGQMYLR